MATDKVTQTFTAAGGVAQTSIYRMFPASKSNTTEADDDLEHLDDSMAAVFASKPGAAGDQRSHYRLVGAIWLDRPERDFKLDKQLVNNEKDPDIVAHGTDSDNSILAGEDRLSSTSMESFTQPDFLSPHCFSCHDTRAVRRDKTNVTLVEAKLLNISHVFSRFIDESQ